MQTTPPSLQVRQSDTNTGENWSVRATWEDGTFEEISGFENDDEAHVGSTTNFNNSIANGGHARARSCGALVWPRHGGRPRLGHARGQAFTKLRLRRIASGLWQDRGFTD